jgi:Na+/melibiose symporter-like transporter
MDNLLVLIVLMLVSFLAFQIAEGAFVFFDLHRKNRWAWVALLLFGLVATVAVWSILLLPSITTILKK